MAAPYLASDERIEMKTIAGGLKMSQAAWVKDSGGKSLKWFLNRPINANIDTQRILFMRAAQ